MRSDVAAGALLHVRRGWYAVPGAPADAVAAVTMGGRLTCAAALRLHGVWCLPDDSLHIAIEPRGRRPAARRGLVVHRGRLHSARAASPAVDSALESLERLARCAPRPAFVVAADSAINRGLVTLPALMAVVATSSRGRRLMAAVDGKCESGIETVARLALRRHRVRYRPQVDIDGVGRVDLLVGDRLVLEFDGFEWHGTRGAFEEDRRRDQALTERGFRVVRVSYRQTLYEWTRVEGVILGLVRRREHIRRRAGRHNVE